MIIQPLLDGTGDRVAVLSQNSPRAVIDLYIEEAFLDIEERLGVSWEDVTEPSEQAQKAVVVIVSSSIATILKDAGGISRVSSISESALGHSQSIQMKSLPSRWVNSADIERIRKHLGLEVAETDKNKYEVFYQANYSVLPACSCVSGVCWCP